MICDGGQKGRIKSNFSVTRVGLEDGRQPDECKRKQEWLVSQPEKNNKVSAKLGNHTRVNPFKLSPKHLQDRQKKLTDNKINEEIRKDRQGITIANE